MKPDEADRTALHHSLILPALYKTNPQLKINKTNIAALLISAEPRALSVQDNAGETPIYLMATYDFAQLITVAIRHLTPDSFFIPNNYDLLPIHAAISNHHQDALVALLAVPNMITVTDINQQTLIHHAVHANNLNALQYLLENHEFDLSTIDGQGKTPLDIAKSYHYHQIIDFLISYDDQSIINNRIK